ncbi:MAG: hypothetical protein IJV92_06785 [Phascolarctobacterium sp.]|nr:hypothetical protein [Phascolarctobacterium sp.]
MKKVLSICIGLLAMANIAFANDIEKINHLSTDEASKICGEKFSTTYFNDQYEKLALLKRCELSLKTVPLPIWNLEKYVENKIEIPYSELGINKLEDVKSFLAVEKIGKHKVITVSHLYKQNKKLYALNTSLLSEKDQLYILSTYDVDDKVLAPKEDEKLEDVPEIIKRMHAKEEEKIVNVTPAEIDAEVRKNIWDEHMKFVKKFKPSRFKAEALETK